MPGARLEGLAYGLALAAGLTSPRPEHWLVAMMYCRDESLLSLLHAKGITQDAVLTELRARGVDVPASPPTPYRPWRGTQWMYVLEEDLDQMIHLLNERHPGGSEWRWGFNTVGDPRRGRISAEEGIDLVTIAHDAGATIVERPAPASAE